MDATAAWVCVRVCVFSCLRQTYRTYLNVDRKEKNKHYKDLTSYN